MTAFVPEFNKIAIQEIGQMPTDKEAIGLSRVHMYESNIITRKLSILFLNTFILLRASVLPFQKV